MGKNFQKFSVFAHMHLRFAKSANMHLFNAKKRKMYKEKSLKFANKFAFYFIPIQRI